MWIWLVLAVVALVLMCLASRRLARRGQFSVDRRKPTSEEAIAEGWAQSAATRTLHSHNFSSGPGSM